LLGDGFALGNTSDEQVNLITFAFAGRVGLDRTNRGDLDLHVRCDDWRKAGGECGNDRRQAGDKRNIL